MTGEPVRAQISISRERRANRRLNAFLLVALVISLALIVLGAWQGEDGWRPM